MSLFVAQFENVSVSATQDLFSLELYQAVPVRFHSLFLYNVGADVGDAAEEMLRLQILWMGATFTGGTGGSTADPVAVEMQSGNPGRNTFTTVEVNNTGLATTTGTTVPRGVGGWNIRMPFERIWTPETRPLFTYDADNGGDAVAVVRLLSTPADAISMSGELTFEEIGN